MQASWTQRKDGGELGRTMSSITSELQKRGGQSFLKEAAGQHLGRPAAHCALVPMSAKARNPVDANCDGRRW